MEVAARQGVNEDNEQARSSLDSLAELNARLLVTAPLRAARRWRRR
jgi:hypothetical protein